MSPHYKITYFGPGGRAETLRLALVEGGQEFEDVYLPFGPELFAIKHTFPYQQLPLMEVDGKVLPQSGACARYLARKYST